MPTKGARKPPRETPCLSIEKLLMCEVRLQAAKEERTLSSIVTLALQDYLRKTKEQSQ